MEYELTRDWKYSGGPADNPGAKILPEGTVLGSIEIKDGVPMTPQMLADALQRKLAREHKVPMVPGPIAAQQEKAKAAQLEKRRKVKAKPTGLDE